MSYVGANLPKKYSKLKFGDRVTIDHDFYKGMVGTVIDEIDCNYYIVSFKAVHGDFAQKEVHIRHITIQPLCDSPLYKAMSELEEE